MSNLCNKLLYKSILILLLYAISFSFFITPGETALSRVPILQRLSLPQGCQVPHLGSVAFLVCCTIGGSLCFLACAQLNGWNCACFCPHSQFVESVSSCPNLSWYAAKCPWPDLAAISHPWISLLNLSSGRDFAREVGLRPRSKYVCVAVERASESLPLKLPGVIFHLPYFTLCIHICK